MVYNMEKVFKKNDNSFICQNCSAYVDKLGYTSRDHCNVCLASLHVDINPGDRNNNCLGLMLPVCIRDGKQKGYIIEYICEKCGSSHNNKTAEDDNYDAILSLSCGQYINFLNKLKTKK